MIYAQAAVPWGNGAQVHGNAAQSSVAFYSDDRWNIFPKIEV